MCACFYDWPIHCTSFKCDCTRATYVVKLYLMPLSSLLDLGMHLTAKVKVIPHCYSRYSGVREISCHRAFVQVDRGCITATECSCGSAEWCCHVLALILTRIQQSDKCRLVLHPPLSETLSQFSRDQLQKATQLVVEKLLLKGVPVMQGIACVLQDSNSEMNKYSGAPGRRYRGTCQTWSLCWAATSLKATSLSSSTCCIICVFWVPFIIAPVS